MAVLAATAAYAEEGAQDWHFESTTSLPFRGFEIQTGDPSSPDPLHSLSYSPAPSLEETLFLAYQGFGLAYSRTLFAGEVDGRQSVNDGLSFNYLANFDLFEFSLQRLRGLQTEVALDSSLTSRAVGRSDLQYDAFQLKWVRGIPLWGADQPNSLANFYTQALIPEGDLSVDLLYSVEGSHEAVAGDAPFVPKERAPAFGTASTLSKVSSTGLGAGVGMGFTALMGGRSYFSLAGLLGGNYNRSTAYYSGEAKNVSGFGLYANARMAVRYLFGSQELGFRLTMDSWQIPAEEARIAAMDAEMALTYGVSF
jgi:hypothetical protein